MAKNVVIFSDGTGQVGGLRFDEARTNVYKLYRAARCGPDSSIDPDEQVAFYDPGIGSQADGGHLVGRMARAAYNVVSQATGLGLTANVVDCYAALIRLWEPGDRVFLFGFSRGAYTIRCLSGVLALCGVPQSMPGGKPVPLDVGGSRRVARHAVKHVYQFTASRPEARATARQRFLMATRRDIAARFRLAHGCDHEGRSNCYPYFIGAFDTVAALADLWKGIALAAVGVVGLAILGGLAAVVGGALGIPLGFTPTFLALLLAAAGCACAALAYTHVKMDYAAPGPLRDRLATLHVTEFRQHFYDTDLNENVGYAKHAISIDEDRRDFARVPWTLKAGDARHATSDPHENPWFEQVWFAGCHADVGGGYGENESRLSDVALDWMARCAAAVPHGLRIDRSVLRTSPRHDGVQHDEVKAGLGLPLLRWPRGERRLPGPDAIMHPSVYRRFDSTDVAQYDAKARYRPETLRAHADFARFYEADARFPAKSAVEAKHASAEPPPIGV